MKILVLSDSHGKGERMCDLFKQDNYGAVIFLGDVLRDIERLSQISGAIPVYRVKGNCDFYTAEAYDDLLIELSGKRIYMAHGHKYSVKSGTAFFENFAMAKGADIALYGHTHVQRYDRIDNMHVVNPGALVNGRYAVITIQNNTIEVKLKDIYD